MSCLTATSPLKDDPQRPAQRTRPSWRIYLRVIDLLDTTDKLKTVMFAAVNLSSLPGYGPEDTNACALAERQTNLRATVDQLAAKVDGLGQPVQLDRQQFEISSDVKQTLTLIDKTRSSADADNRLDAFISGQSSPCHK